MSAGPDRRFPATAFSAVRRAQGATSDVPCRHLVQPDRVRSSQGARIASTAPPSRGEASTLRSVFHQQVLPDPMLAHGCPGTRHRSRRCCHLRAGFRRSTSISPERPSGPHLRGSPSIRPWKTCTTRGPELAPRTLADQICRLSTSAITTVLEHDHGSDRHPARPAEGYPSALRLMRAASRLSTRCWPSCHRLRGRRTTFRCLPAPPGARGAGALPQP
jgi:hypothetical protein